MPPSPRDRKAVLALVEKAQLVYLLTRYPKKQVLDDATDVARLQHGLSAMRVAAKDLSARLREAHPAVAWDELAKEPEDAELAWRRAKRLAPTVLRELTPLLEGEPEAAFFLRPEATKKTTKKAPRGRGAARSARATRRRAR